MLFLPQQANKDNPTARSKMCSEHSPGRAPYFPSGGAPCNKWAGCEVCYSTCVGIVGSDSILLVGAFSTDPSKSQGNEPMEGGKCANLIADGA